MTKHTQGPWEAYPPDETRKTWHVIAHCGARLAWRIESGSEEADARLIAAAPELFEALKVALESSGCDGDLCSHVWHEAARAAIAKAEGRDR